MAKWSHKYAVEIGPTWISQLVENRGGKLPGNLFFKQFDQILMVNTRRNIARFYTCTYNTRLIRKWTHDVLILNNRAAFPSFTSYDVTLDKRRAQNSVEIVNLISLHKMYSDFFQFFLEECHSFQNYILTITVDHSPRVISQ